MTKLSELVRVFIKGGIVSPSDLLRIVNTAEKLGAQYIQFGSRQDILFPTKQREKGILDEVFDEINMKYEINDFKHQNISSSYAAMDLLPSKKWLASHIYHYILDDFDYLPKLRINIVDPSQSLVPLFTGNINFIASNEENCWYLYLRFSSISSTPWQAPFLVYGEDVKRWSKIIEGFEVEKNNLSYKEVLDRLSKHELKTRSITDELVFADTNFPYYEGLNRLADGKYWLGIYWRDNKVKLGVLKEICKRCQHTETGQICLTPWKSFVVRGIFEKDRIGWEKVLGELGMNLRHSALELNWHLPALDLEALELKNYLVRAMDVQDVSTYGLTFTIKTTEDITVFTSIVVEKNREKAGTYNIMYSKDFNPNLTEYNCYAQGVLKEVIAPLLIELSHLYYNHLEEEKESKITETPTPVMVKSNIYQCQKCLTVYDQDYGDSNFGIDKGVPFEELPENYSCSTCGAGKQSFQLLPAY